MAKINHCLFCGDPIRKGRSDKKFCDSACKDTYYNEKKVDENKEIKKVNSVLKKNRRVLKDVFNPKKADKLTTREEMIKKGFEFGFLTHIVVTRTKSNEFIFCYDYGYREVEPMKYQIIEGYAKVKIKDGDTFKLK